MLSGWSWWPTLTNHCRLISGSTTESHRWQWPTECRYSSTFSSKPRDFNSATTSSRTWNRSLPAYLPAASVMLPSSPITVIISRPWRWPISKSTMSWPGVTFSAPVPKSWAMASSPTMGMARPMMGNTACFPTRSRYRGSSGCTATPVSPSMVSGRVVATVMWEVGSSAKG